jgi:hypothetical protein
MAVVLLLNSCDNSISRKGEDMRRIFTMAAFVALLTAPAFAFEWSGQLVDANRTKADGTVHACDAGTFMSFRADYLASQQAAPPVNVTMVGEREGNTILVTRIYLD